MQKRSETPGDHHWWKTYFYEAHCQYMQLGKQQIKSFDKNKEIAIDGTNKIFIWSLYYFSF